MTFAIGDRFFLGLELEPQLLLHVAYTATYTAVRTHRIVLTQHIQYVGVDGRVAQRTTGSPWWCQTISPQDLARAYALTAFAYLPESPTFIGGVTSATALGVAVWRVTIDLTNRKETLNIAQDSYRLVRITEVIGPKTSASGLIKRFSDFSRYGESVTAQLPQACR